MTAYPPPLQVPVLALLQNQLAAIIQRQSSEAGAIEEASLLRQLGLKLQTEAPVSADMALFQQHFVLYHLLYRLQQEWLAQQQGYLHIPLARIQLQPHQDSSLSEDDCSRRDYYLNWQHFYAMTEQMLDEQLSAFWQQVAGRSQPGTRLSYSQAIAILGLPERFSIHELKRAYRSLALQQHPDRGGSEREFILLTEAYQLLLQRFW